MGTTQLIRQLEAATPDRPVRLGRYDVTGMIGQGGMGTVYDAIDLEHGTRVALKTLTRLEPENLLRFKNEFRSVADLSHPNLVSLYELSYHEDLWFFTMEHIDGIDLVEWLRGEPMAKVATGSRTVVESPRARKAEDSGEEPGAAADAPSPSMPPSVERIRDSLRQLVAAVHALHEAGYLHLDLKPSNVLVDRQGRVFVLDFGLIRPVDEPRRAAADDDDRISISGTPMWMAPEQFTDAQIGKPADWYAVGLMLYWGLTGVPAFPAAANATETGSARQHMQPTPPVERVDGLPADLSELAVALLQTGPGDRPSGKTLLELTAGAEALATKQRASFVGRESELACLRDCYNDARTSEARVVHVSGSSGLGKTALLRQFLLEVRAGDGLVLNGRCYERETVPYKAFDGLLDQLAAHLGELDESALSSLLPRWIVELVRVFPVLESVPAIAAKLQSLATVELVTVVEMRRRATEALRELFDTMAARAPLVLEIDDLQWADGDSVSLLLRLLEAPAPRGLLLVVSFRPEEASASAAVAPYLAAAAGLGDRLVDIEVGPLPAADATRLAQLQLRALDMAIGDLAVAIADESAGVPFFIEELCHYVTQYRESTGAGVLAAGISLDTVLAARVKGLPDLERSLVEVLSVANNPIPLFVAFEEAGISSGALRSLWALRGRHLIRTTGAGAEDLVELHHDRMRESVLKYLSSERIGDIHLGLARAFAEEDDTSVSDAWLFDSVRHFNNVHDKLHGAERRLAAQLNRDAGLKAQAAAAFRLAYDCFRAGTELLEDDTWDSDYDLSLALYGGAAEMAYLSSQWHAVDGFVDAVKRNARTILDQLVGWEVQIDACIARKAYGQSVAVAIEALQLLDVDLPANPGEAEVGAAVQLAMESLAKVGAEGLMALAEVDDPRVVAALRIQSRISSAAYFAAPTLFPLLACRQITTCVERGLSPVTAYALSVYGIVLNTLGMHTDAHTWGRVSLELLARFNDPSFEARTRHVVHNLVDVWTVPLSSAVRELRKVVDVGKSTGDVEYAAYAAHGYIHNAMYAGWKLGPLFEEALELGDFMRGHEQVNALHVHEPFEQMLRCYIGLKDDPSRLDGDGFDEKQALDAAKQAGSSAGEAAMQTVMGMARYLFGSADEAHAFFANVRPMLAAMPSVWHVPMFHQYSALAIYALDDSKRAEHAADAEASIAALRHMAEHGPENFAHRVVLVEAERARVSGDVAAALDGFERAIAMAKPGDWLNDIALAHELAAKCGGDTAAGHREAAISAYKSWGAFAKLA